MKKLSKSLIIMLIMIMALATLFVACAPKETVEYNVSFDVDGVVTATMKTGGNGSLLSTPTEPTKEGFVFGGWYLDKDTWAQPVTFESVKNKPLKADIKVFAKWNIPERTVFNVKFDLAGGQTDKDFEQFLNYTRVKNDTLIVPTPVWREGFVFKGWSPELVHIVTADVTYTAVWEVAKCKYSFWDGVGGILKEETINYGEKIVPPTVTPTRAPDMQFTYTFSHWDKVVPEKITEDIHFFARFETTVNKYTITFLIGKDIRRSKNVPKRRKKFCQLEKL
ncbi:MAG: InlB B-repeat-containing protein [Clostridia bacterium]